MQPDPAELKALEDAVVAFEEAYVGLMQAVRRIKLIYEIEKVRPESPKKPPMVMHNPKEQQTEISGNSCPRCFSIRLRNKGGGCMICADCGFDLGCNG